MIHNGIDLRIHRIKPRERILRSFRGGDLF
jgi:hypothetical protein